MSTLLLRLAAPLQSWGLEGKFSRRDTAREPTKSGVIGLLAAALGRGREDPINDLTGLRFGVRVDQPGQLLVDYHLAMTEKARNPDTGQSAKNAGSFISRRHYLADAVFLVGLEGENGFLDELDKAVCSPIFPLYLGRRSCPPVGKVSLGIRSEPLEEALKGELWQGSDRYRKKYLKNGDRLTFVYDSVTAEGYYRKDQPLTFNQSHRQYTVRPVITKDEENCVLLAPESETEHDPMKELEE